MENKILVILGPTASGKSDLAVKLAKKFKGEIISADSRQVYKELDIGTGKITKKEMLGIPHHLLNISSPKKSFSVAQWKEKALEKIKNIISRGKLPIICGGTGFYIQSIVDNVTFPEVLPNSALRKELKKKGVEELFKILQKIDSQRAETIEREQGSQNPVRLIRAIEIAKALGKVPPLDFTRGENSYEFLQIGLKLSDTELKERINKRFLSWMKKGLVKEALNLKNSVGLKRVNEIGLEYKYLALFLENKMTREEMIKKSQTEIWRYAKRQITWFKKKDKRIKWFGPSDISKVQKEINRFIG